MAELTCSVNTCASHNGGYCCRNSIKIDGHSAVMKDQTFCGSFQQKTGGAVNAACGSTPNPHMEIRCSASHCAHNQGGHCSAENVDCFRRLGHRDDRNHLRFSKPDNPV